MTELLKVLLVEDSEEDADLVTLALKRGGFVMRSGEAEERRLRLNLLKSVNFVFIPENNFGLASQYPRKPGRPRGAAAKVEKKRKVKRIVKPSGDERKAKKEKQKKEGQILELPPAS